jgi:hypothetical protein
MGFRVCQLLATLRVALSLTLFALGGTDPIGRFYLRNRGAVLASNTSYHKHLHGSHQFICHILALFTVCRCLVVLAHDLERRGSILLYFM